MIEDDHAAPEAMKPGIELLETLNFRVNLDLEWVYPVVREQAKGARILDSQHQGLQTDL